jgi:hypothetical protein
VLGGVPAPAVRESPASSSPCSPVFVGLGSVLLGVPVAVLGTAAGPYDDPKAWALPILVALTGLAWVSQRRSSPARTAGASDGFRRWLWGIIAAYFFWWILTTLTSLAPWQSLLGNFGRGLGLLTFGSAILLFPLVWSECRTPRAVRALIDAALLGSVPVCGLALGQALGWDPLPKAWDPSVAALNVRSTFGQHIFLGSYLAALIPLVVARLAWGLGEREPVRHEEDSSCSRRRSGLVAATWAAGAIGLVALGSRWDLAWWLLVPWGVIGAVGLGFVLASSGAAPLLSPSIVAAILTAQVTVVVLCQARGAFFGMLAGLSVTAFALLARRRAWKWMASAAAVLVAVAIFLMLLNVPTSPLAGLRAMPLLSRLSHLADVRHGSPGWFRLQVWKGTLDGWGRQLDGETLASGLSPNVRSLLGYGLETQLLTLDRLALPNLGILRVRGEGWDARYLADRAHNIALDHLLTGGLVGVGLWALVTGSLLASGVARARAATTPAEVAVRVGAIGAIVAHLVEGQVGIVTPMPLALFWIIGALCAMPAWSEREDRPAASPRPAWWIVALVVIALVAAPVAWLETRWLRASIAYAEGSRSNAAGRTAEAYRHFQRARSFVPWLPLPAEATAYTGLRLAAAEGDLERRLALLRDSHVALAGVGRPAGMSGGYWTLRAQVAFARVRAGERDEVEASLEAFERAARLRPGDGQLLSQWAWALLDAQKPARARAVAEKATAQSPRADLWLAWAVLSRAARDLGDGAAAERAAGQARSLAPPEAGRVLSSLGLEPG